MPITLQNALIRGKDRWDDVQYLTRIIFSEMIKDDILGTAGYGISSFCGDGDNNIIEVNTDEETISYKENTYKFSEYINMDFKTS